MYSGDDSWARMGWASWSDLDEVRARLAAGADPNGGASRRMPPLFDAARWGSADVVAELAGRVDDVDATYDGRTALWVAVLADKPDNARALVAAGADPWRPMMAGWSPGRLGLAGRTPELFDAPPGEPGLSPAEAATVAEAHRLIDAIGEPHHEGLSLCCVAGIDATEAVRRLGATTLDATLQEMSVLWDGPLAEDALLTVGVTDVPGGCVVTQPWAYGASTPLVSILLSPGTVTYAMYANPKSGNQGSSAQNGAILGWDLHPGGGWPSADAPADEVLVAFLYRHRALAYCCAHAGLRLTDARAIVGPPDHWLRLPRRDWWARQN